MNTPKTLLIAISALWLLPAAAQTPDNSDSDTVKYGNNAAAGKYVNIRGFNMYYETYGQGEPLLLIHGNGGSISHFNNQIPFFEAHYKVIVADSRAQGKSADGGDSLSYEMMADDFNALLDSLKLKQVNVVGWSDGGINGLLLAMRHPEKVKKLAVTGANLWPDSTAVDPFAWRWAMAYNDSLAKLPSSPEVKNNRKLAHLLSYEPNIKTAQLKKIQCPVLVMGGDNDVILARHTLLIAESIPQSYLYIFPRSGHSTLIFYKAQFNSTVLDFFRKPYRKIEGMGKFD